MALTTGIESIPSVQDTYAKYKDMFTDSSKDLITMSNFYQLLVAEMQNQDPLEPTSNTEFISQMASFSALQSQQDAYKTQQLSYANSLVGKTVTVSLGDGKTATGIVNYVNSNGETPKVNVNGENYKLSDIAQIHDNGGGSSTIGDYGAFAASILGKTAVVQAMDATGTTYVDEGIVESIEIEKGNVREVVNGYAYDATDVLRVTETQTAAQTSTPVYDAPEELAAAAPEQVTQFVQRVDEADIPDEDDYGSERAEILELFE